MTTEYFILRRGRLEGPFQIEEVVRQLEEGALTPADLGQTSHSRYWTPLRKLLSEADTPIAQSIVAPRFTHFMADIGERIWIAFLHYPFEAGLTCLVFGILVAVFSFWPLIVYGPWMMASLVAGAMVFLRGRTAAGVGLCAAAILLPIIVAILFKS